MNCKTWFVKKQQAKENRPFGRSSDCYDMLSVASPFTRCHPRHRQAACSAAHPQRQGWAPTRRSTRQRGPPPGGQAQPHPEGFALAAVKEIYASQGGDEIAGRRLRKGFDRPNEYVFPVHVYHDNTSLLFSAVCRANGIKPFVSLLGGFLHLYQRYVTPSKTDSI